jgi:SRR1
LSSGSRHPVQQVAQGVHKNQTMSQNDGEWTTVTKNDKKRMAKRSQRRRPPTATTTTKHDSEKITTRHHGPVALSNTFSLQEASSLLTMEQAARVITDCTQNFSRSAFLKNLKASLASSTTSISQIVCYGIGNFLTTSMTTISAPMWQLVCALAIRDELLQKQRVVALPLLSGGVDDSQGSNNVSQQVNPQSVQITNRMNPKLVVPMYYYDPCMTVQEGQLLEQMGVELFPTNERGKRLCTTRTLFFMPHCPMALYTNVLHTNWERLDQLVIFGNNLTDYANRLEAEPTQAVHLLQVLLPFLEQHAMTIAKEDLFEMPGYFEKAFNDSCVSHFKRNNSIPVSTTTNPGEIGKWPDRPCLDDNEETGEVL